MDSRQALLQVLQAFEQLEQAYDEHIFLITPPKNVGETLDQTNRVIARESGQNLKGF